MTAYISTLTRYFSTASYTGSVPPTAHAENQGKTASKHRLLIFAMGSLVLHPSENAQ